MAIIFYDRDADIERVRRRRVGILGYGEQGRAHALNVSDSGVDVRVGAIDGSKEWCFAEADGMAVGDLASVASWADVIVLLVPEVDTVAIYTQHVEPHLAPGKTIVFHHASAVVSGAVRVPSAVDVALVSPKGPGELVRRSFVAGEGVPALMAIHHDASGSARADVLAYAKALGSTRAWILETTFRKEHDWRRAPREQESDDADEAMVGAPRHGRGLFGGLRGGWFSSLRRATA